MLKDFGNRRIVPSSLITEECTPTSPRSSSSHPSIDQGSCYHHTRNSCSTDDAQASDFLTRSFRLNHQRSFTHWIPNVWTSFVLILLVLSSCFLQVDSSALTTNVAAGERLCFYAWVDKANEKVGFYFAVQSGGSFDIDWTVTDPHDTIVIEGEKDRQGDYIFTAASVGEYSFCFNNDMSSFSEKYVDFDIMVENEPRPVAPAKPTSIAEQTSSLEDSIFKLSGSLSNIQRTQKYFRTRENRNLATVKDTQNRIFYVNVGTSLLLIGMSFTQVFIVRKFFNSPGKYVRV